MTAMIDTHVLIFACRSPKDRDSADLKGRIAAATALLRTLDEIRVCAVAWFEFQRFLRDEERPIFERYRGRLRIDPVDAAVAERAVALFNARRSHPTVCRECLGTRDGHVCKGCRNRVCTTQRINDALIAASAEVQDDVTILYSDDSGIHDFALSVDPSRCEVRRPPHPDGELFERVQRAAAR